MSAEGYKTEPLSTEMERRIKDRINRCKEIGRQTPELKDTAEAWATALQWVITEAQVIKLETPIYAEPAKGPQ